MKFPAQPQLQISPVKPSAENLGGRYNMGAKLLSLPLDDRGDPTKEYMDAEASGRNKYCELKATSNSLKVTSSKSRL